LGEICQNAMNREETNLFGGRAAAVLGGVLLVGFAALSLLSAVDRHDRGNLEKLESPSAAGDAVVYHLPENPAEGEPAPPAVTRDGVAFYPHRVSKHSDGVMMKAGTDDSGKIPLYRRLRRDVLKEELYIKIAPGRFLELRNN